MTPDQFRRSKEIFHAALEKPPESRFAFVEESSADDAGVKSEVLSLLASENDAGGFLEGARLPNLPESMTAEAAAESDLADERRRIGPYMVIREIGRGGMGSVFLAERSDLEYRGLVALKLVKRGMDTDFILQRFRSERQILASLNHPNIARLLDGGTTGNGLPYFVMEYIEGEHLTDYCRGRDLPLPSRIELFRTVCSAVQFAHRNLVIHRDIKPSNILVTTDGIPKLLDFGLAKVLDPERSGESFYQTVAGVGIFTPEYASPEQMRGENITTATDIYSLGVVLYEVLSGVHPYRRTDAGPAELTQAILETEFPAPSLAAARTGDAARTRALEGDLDTIILTAVRKEPERRYGTVEQISDDLRRHLEGLPVSARADTLVYRAGKFIRRHRISVAAALLVFLSLAGGLGVALVQTRVARDNERLAEKRFAELRRLARTVLFDLHDRIKPLPGSTPVRSLLVTTALEYLNNLATDAGKDRELLRELAEAYARVGDVQGGVAQGSLGDTSGALASYRKALEIRERLCASPGAGDADRSALAESLRRMSDIFWLTGDSAASLAAARRAVPIVEELLRKAPDDPVRKVRLARALHVLADAEEVSGNLDDAVETSRFEARICEEISRANPGDTQARSSVLVGHYEVGFILLRKGDVAAALPELRIAADIGEELSRKEPGDTNVRRLQAFAQMQLGSAHASTRDWEPALEAFRLSRVAFESILAADPRNANVRMNLGSLYSRYGHALTGSGRTLEGVSLQNDGIRMLDMVSSDDPGNAAARKEKNDAEARLGTSRGGAGR